jgi:hypothetical protein
VSNGVITIIGSARPVLVKFQSFIFGHIVIFIDESGKLVQASEREFIYVRNSRSQVSSTQCVIKAENT